MKTNYILDHVNKKKNKSTKITRTVLADFGYAALSIGTFNLSDDINNYTKIEIYTECGNGLRYFGQYTPEQCLATTSIKYFVAYRSDNDYSSIYFPSSTSVYVSTYDSYQYANVKVIGIKIEES